MRRRIVAPCATPLTNDSSMTNTTRQRRPWSTARTSRKAFAPRESDIGQQHPDDAPAVPDEKTNRSHNTIREENGIRQFDELPVLG